MDPFDDRKTRTAPTQASETAGASICALRVHASGREYPLAADQHRFTIGSAPSSDLVIDDPFASSAHCVLERRGTTRLVVRDRASRNGTRVNGVRVEVAELRLGATLEIGSVVLVVCGAPNSATRSAYEQLCGEAPVFRRAVETALQCAPSRTEIIILGETGTGKELFAQLIHEASRRAAGPFVAVNCGGIPAELIESELFGHKKGAFTSAHEDRDGLFVRADGGTLFLDELAELPRAQQPHLLRVLETRTVRRVGCGTEIPIDIRLISATNDFGVLSEASSRLRMDLFHRVAVVPIYLPPLRERREDIDLLVGNFMDLLAEQHGRRRISRTTLRALRAFPWPGNVRELRNAVTRAVTMCPDELTLESLLPRPAPIAPVRAEIVSLSDPQQHAPPRSSLAGRAHDVRGAAGHLNHLDTLTRSQIVDALRSCGTLRAAARAMRIPKSTLADRARRLGIDVNPKKRGAG